MSNYRRVFIQNSYVFLTIITYNRLPILIENIDLLRDAFRNVKKNYMFKIIACAVLPDHLHIIIYSENIKEYPKIISAVKHYFSVNLNKMVTNLSSSKIKKREKGIWHRRYIEHTIISENDLSNHINYIHYNPIKHGLVNDVKDWEYSTFHKFADKAKYNLHWEEIADFKRLENLYE